MKIEEVKNVWNEYADLIKTLAALFLSIASGVAYIAMLVITAAVSSTIKTEVAQVKAVTDLVIAVSVLTEVVENAEEAVTSLNDSVIVLQGDVTDIHKHLAGIE